QGVKRAEMLSTAAPDCWVSFGAVAVRFGAVRDGWPSGRQLPSAHRRRCQARGSLPYAGVSLGWARPDRARGGTAQVRIPGGTHCVMSRDTVHRCLATSFTVGSGLVVPGG